MGGLLDDITSAFGWVSHEIIHGLYSLPPVAVYAVVAALVFAEAAVFVGFVLPGETAVLIGGVLASQHRLSLTTTCVVVVVFAVAGDTVGFEVGRWLGPAVLRLRILQRHEARIDAARTFLRRRGGIAVFLGRFTAFLRAVTPGLAGVSRMRYRTFLAWNAAGALCWGVGFTLIGYFAGSSYGTIASYIGRASAVVVVLLIVAVLIARHLQHRRREEREEAAWDATHSGPEQPG